MTIVLERIRERLPELTDSERLIAHWLQQHTDELAFKPAGYIALQCGVSESTVVRFARKIGFESYPEMQGEAQTSVQQQLSLRQKLHKSVATTASDRVLDTVLHQDIANLQHCAQTVAPSAFKEAVRRLAEGRQIGVIGRRASAGAASYLSFTLNLIRPRVRLIGSGGEMLDHLLDFGPEDVVVAISVVKAAPRTLEAARYCQEKGIPLIGLTDWQYAPLSGYAEVCLKVPATGVFWESQTAVVSLCNALIAGVGHTLSDTAAKRLKLFEEAHAGSTTREELL